MSNQQHVVLLPVHRKFGRCVEFVTLVPQDLEDGAHREFRVSTDSFDPNSVRHSGILGPSSFVCHVYFVCFCSTGNVKFRMNGLRMESSEETIKFI